MFDDELEAPAPSGLSHVPASGRPSAAARLLAPGVSTLEPFADDPSEAPEVPARHVAARPMPHVVTTRPAPVVRVVEHPTAPARDERAFYLAMAGGLVCTAIALAMLLTS